MWVSLNIHTKCMYVLLTLINAQVNFRDSCEDPEGVG